MTLILTLSAPGLIAHVSDRQVTRLERGRPSSIHSPVENKTIIFLVRDAIGVLGYTGNAYVRSEPTDEWLAKQIAPTAFDCPHEFTFGLGGNRREGLNDVIWRLRQALSGGALRRGEQLAICIGGFRVRRHRFVSFQAEFGWPPEFIGDSFHMRRPRSMSEAWVVSQIGDTFPDNEFIPRFSATVPEAQATGEHPYVGAMARLVRARALQSELVGSNLMAVWIPQPSHRRVFWEFMPAEAHNAILVSPTVTQPFEAMFSPWVISPGCVSRPSFGTGHFTISTCGWTIAPMERRIRSTKMNEKSGDEQTFFAVTHQSRQPPPR